MVPVHQPIIVNFFFKYSLDVRTHYLWHFKPVIGDSAVCCSLSSHIFVSPPPSLRPDGTNLYSLVNRELMGVSSLSKAISQKPSRQASNPQPSDPESETLTTRPRTHQHHLNVFFLPRLIMGMDSCFPTEGDLLIRLKFPEVVTTSTEKLLKKRFLFKTG